MISHTIYTYTPGTRDNEFNFVYIQYRAKAQRDASHKVYVLQYIYIYMYSNSYEQYIALGYKRKRNIFMFV